ncbi:sigma-70 family RNA polymerase sigma factor [Dyadobacter frigoris]|uniref:Sigma-70 family RNA polymerase sigma factor n=1 Tax=Dyadobacter frigoris TaxID=2576211 RepID=A0A4U6CVK1_9BACT|nr:sigma-70 family RNA polymerase sigma factor [Dyadobacter frigoris]TKT87631.1 sigma-70 family RNA polymerase sigma factor [Dyadobacter frigoris]GLU52692.1 hypothetical protein Dfri01_21530 [Dyadobacter frigoris]
MTDAQKIKSDEHALIAAIKNGGTNKNKYVTQLINDYQGYIHKLHSKTSISESILKDIFTDTVLLVLEHIESETFRGESKLSTYFYKIFYFKAVDYLRHHAANKIDYMDSLPEYADDKQNIMQQLESTETLSQIIQLLDKMCLPCRQIIMGWAYWGFKTEEISDRIGESDPVKYSKIKYNCIVKFKKLWNKIVDS